MNNERHLHVIALRSEPGATGADPVTGAGLPAVLAVTAARVPRLRAGLVR